MPQSLILRLILISLICLAGCQPAEKPNDSVQSKSVVKPQQPDVGESTIPNEAGKPAIAENSIQVNENPEQADDSDPGFVYDSVLPEIDSKWKRLDLENEIWLDMENKQIVVGGQICFRLGQLEMFACPRNTKEHESVVSVNCQAQLIHAALLALEIQPGHTVQFDPEYKPAEGPEIEITVRWLEGGKVVERRSQEMVRSFRDKKELSYPWIFAGSSFYEDPDTHERFYRANGGQMVCVSNFSDAMIDLPVVSSAEASNLLFEANTKKIPGLGTRVLLIIKASSQKTEK